MVRAQVSLDSELYEQAQAEARRLGVSFAELCRLALMQQLARYQRDEDPPWMSFAGAVETGSPDSSQSVDDVVYGRRRL